MSEGKLASKRVDIEDSLDAINDWLYQQGATDGLPVIPPTEDRVMRMLEQVKRDPQEVVAEVPPARGKATVEKIAINAVMAGCLPSYLPVVIAAVEAMVEPEFNLYGVQATTNPVAPLAIINGPIRQQLNINCGHNALGQGQRSNATIGRAIRLILLNIGGGVPETVDKATLGMPGKFTFCLGENEEGNPWEPLHVERGFEAGTSTVTMVGATGTTNILDEFSKTAQGLLKVIAGSMNALGSNNMIFWPGEPLLVLCPEHAAIMARDGLAKSDVKHYLYEHTCVPVSSFSEEAQRYLVERGRVEEDRVYLALRPEDIMIVVAGGAGPHSVFLPTFGKTVAVTKTIE